MDGERPRSEKLARSQSPSVHRRGLQDRQTESGRAAARTESHQAICRAAAVLGRHRPGSEGNLASDIENTPDNNRTTHRLRSQRLRRRRPSVPPGKLPPRKRTKRRTVAESGASRTATARARVRQHRQAREDGRRQSRRRESRTAVAAANRTVPAAGQPTAPPRSGRSAARANVQSATEPSGGRRSSAPRQQPATAAAGRAQQGWPAASSGRTRDIPASSAANSSRASRAARRSIWSNSKTRAFSISTPSRKRWACRTRPVCANRN